MKTVGAFEAKTHFSELLRNVENGESYEIRRRGKAVATLIGTVPGHGDIGETLEYFREVRGHAHASHREISEWKQKGRA